MLQYLLLALPSILSSFVVWVGGRRFGFSEMSYDVKNIHSFGGVQFVTLIHDFDHSTFDETASFVPRVNVRWTLLGRFLNIFRGRVDIVVWFQTGQKSEYQITHGPYIYGFIQKVTIILHSTG
jgi:hypothetical protein